MKKDDTVYLRHILDAIGRVDEYVQIVSKEQFLENHLLQDAVVRQLEIIGEASRNVSDEFREKHAIIPWGQIIAFRNRVIHAYFDVNLDIAWSILQNDLLPLKRNVKQILGED